MEEDAESPSRTNSFDINEVTGNIPILTKKRKFQSELLSQPVAKHKCYNQASSIPTSADEGKNTELDSCGSTGWSNLESAQASNSSMTEDTESDMSNFYDMPAYKPGHAKMYTSGTPSTSSFSQGWNSSDYQMCSSDGNVEELARGVIEEDSFLHQEGPINIRKILDEQLLNIHNHVDYTSPEYENDLMEQCGDNETGDHIYTNGGLKSHVLSSERWNIEQESQATTRQPTIDQEFEQYFSMLML